ncbi:hypothetical protein ABID49_001010 [Bhargavaea ullalensis]|uniref:Uncharacterized protein n=1 Tax=Bhargavaea ullalensis TaxID=1265685 RepID=A0ABV2GA19_9BACL
MTEDETESFMEDRRFNSKGKSRRLKINLIPEGWYQ